MAVHGCVYACCAPCRQCVAGCPPPPGHVGGPIILCAFGGTWVSLMTLQIAFVGPLVVLLTGFLTTLAAAKPVAMGDALNGLQAQVINVVRVRAAPRFASVSDLRWCLCLRVSMRVSCFPCLCL
jgi:hypothetical protein